MCTLEQRKCVPMAMCLNRIPKFSITWRQIYRCQIAILDTHTHKYSQIKKFELINISGAVHLSFCTIFLVQNNLNLRKFQPNCTQMAFNDKDPLDFLFNQIDLDWFLNCNRTWLSACAFIPSVQCTFVWQILIKKILSKNIFVHDLELHLIGSIFFTVQKRRIKNRVNRHWIVATCDCSRVPLAV